MVSKTDERKGLVKTYWADVRKRVAKVEPTFAKIVDELAPDKTFPVFLAYYPYGALKGDTDSTFLPDMESRNFYRLTDAPKEVLKHLGYGHNSSPMGIVLEKQLEYFIDLQDRAISIPWFIYSPGSFFPFSTILSKKSSRTYAPNGVLTVTSGTRSAFMLPNIGCATNHINLQRDFNIKHPPAKSLYENWYVFKEILNSPVIDNDWYACIMYFSAKWVEKLHGDKEWLNLKTYLLELAWERFEYERNRVYYEISFSIIQSLRNLKPNPYLADTARHLFAIALGAAPGYVPAHNDDSLPLQVLQKVFVESYGLKKYIPTIMQPIHFNLEHDTLPIYYSLQNPSTFIFSPKSRKVSSTLFDMRELEHLMRVFIDQLSKDTSLCSDTIIGKIAKEIEFKYFHNEPDRHKIIKPTEQLLDYDNRFTLSNTFKVENTRFAKDAPFVRGCVSIQVKN